MQGVHSQRVPGEGVLKRSQCMGGSKKRGPQAGGDHSGRCQRNVSPSQGGSQERGVQKTPGRGRWVLNKGVPRRCPRK